MNLEWIECPVGPSHGGYILRIAHPYSSLLDRVSHILPAQAYHFVAISLVVTNEGNLLCTAHDIIIGHFSIA